MAGKVCIITGATSGVGLEAAKRLASGGAHIVMVCRNRERAENVSYMIKKEFKVPADIIIADLSSLDQVRNAANVILNSYKKIDILINNAGIHCTVPASTP